MLTKMPSNGEALRRCIGQDNDRISDERRAVPLRSARRAKNLRVSGPAGQITRLRRNMLVARHSTSFCYQGGFALHLARACGKRSQAWTARVRRWKSQRRMRG